MPKKGHHRVRRARTGSDPSRPCRAKTDHGRRERFAEAVLHGQARSVHEMANVSLWIDLRLSGKFGPNALIPRRVFPTVSISRFAFGGPIGGRGRVAGDGR